MNKQKILLKLILEMPKEKKKYVYILEERKGHCSVVTGTGLGSGDSKFGTQIGSASNAPRKSILFLILIHI
jgi:hypothetical protein